MSDGHSAIQRSIIHRHSFLYRIGQYRRTGQDRKGQDRTGQERTGHDRTGKDRRLFAATELPVTLLLSAASSFFSAERNGHFKDPGCGREIRIDLSIILQEGNKCFIYR